MTILQSPEQAYGPYGLLCIFDFAKFIVSAQGWDTTDYSYLYTRILMTSILYFSFPNLIKKLDYCLPKPVPDKIRKDGFLLMLK